MNPHVHPSILSEHFLLFLPVFLSIILYNCKCQALVLNRIVCRIADNNALMSDRRSVRSQIGRRDAVVCRGCSHLKNINLYSLGAAHLKRSNWLGAKKFGFGNILYLFISHYNLSFSLIFSLSLIHTHTITHSLHALPVCHHMPQKHPVQNSMKF